MNELALFAGAGGGILGGQLLGWRTVCAVEREPYAASVLAQRQNDGVLAPFPIWDDVCTFDGRPWRGVVDVVSGGFPCQDISAAGKGIGIDGERSGLWREMARIIDEVRPRFVFVENSPMLVGRGLAVVLGDLASIGFDARWGVLGASDVGAPHRRERCWIRAELADTRCPRRPAGGAGGRDSPHGEILNVRTANGSKTLANADLPKWRPISSTRYGLAQRPNGLHSQREEGASGSSAGSKALGDANGLREQQQSRSILEKRGWTGNASWWSAEPDVGRVADGVAARVDRLKAIGNGQVPQCAAEAWRRLTANV